MTDEVDRRITPSPIIEWFDYDHLPAGHGKDVSREVCNLAEMMDAFLPEGPEKSAGLRKLLEAKDCFVRQALKKAKTENDQV